MLDQSRRGKVHPKLRMIGGCGPGVNRVRAEQASALFVPNLAADAPTFRLQEAVPLTPTPDLGLDDAAKPAPAGETAATESDDQTWVNVFVDLRHPGAPPIIGEKSRRGSIALAEISVAEIDQIADRPDVSMVSPGESIKFDHPVVTAATAAPAPHPALLPAGAQPGPVLIGIIDVQGFDFAHEDFLTMREGKTVTRFQRIWDQGGETRKPPAYTDGEGTLRYGGAEIQARHMNAAIAQQAAGGIPAVEYEPQSQRVPGSHGTHVASIAGGNSGVCPHALLAGVLISLPQSDMERSKSFYDSSSLVDAVEYLIDVAEDLGKSMNYGAPLPLSINISLGTNGDAHDGSSPACRWIDNSLSVSGRCVTVASGNSGQSMPMAPGDLGYVMGRIHTAGKIAARGLQTTLEWTVIGNGRADISENELELWYSPQDRFRVWLLPPDSNDWIGPVDERQYIQNRELPDHSYVSIYNEIYHPVNGCNHIAIYLTPRLTPPIVGVPSGVWTVRLEGVEVRDGSFHGWIERDDPAPVGKLGPREAWRFPSFFSERTNVPVSQINSLGCNPRIVAVANLHERGRRIHETSSRGPTRDGRFKPDVAARGTDVVAAKGFTGGKEWVGMTGTSMASPYVAGVAAVMLSVAPRLNAAQIGGIIQRTAQPLPGKTYEWATDSGFGIIDPVACVLEATIVNSRTRL